MSQSGPGEDAVDEAQDGTEDFSFVSLPMSKHKGDANESTIPDSVAEDTFIVVKGESDHFPERSDAQCAICSATFNTEKALKDHEQKSHSKSDFCCSACTSCFSTSIDLRKHSRSKSHRIAIRFLPFNRALHAERIPDMKESQSSSASVEVQSTLASEMFEEPVQHTAAPAGAQRHIFWLHV